MSQPVNVLCLKWGTRYSAEYVNILHRSVRRHLKRPFQFHCFTDNSEGLDPEVCVHPIPEIDLPPKAKNGGWRKLCLFRDDLPISGLGLFLDLDISVTGSLDEFFDYGASDQIPIIHNWVPWHKKLFRPDPQIGNSSVFRFQLNQCKFVWDQFHREKDWALATFSPPQSYLTHCIRPKMCYWPDHWVRSFKRHCCSMFPLNLIFAPKEPKNCKILVFHGRPDPDEAIRGYKGKALRHSTRPVPWLAAHWRL
jgi:hypothetical protein